MCWDVLRQISCWTELFWDNLKIGLVYQPLPHQTCHFRVFAILYDILQILHCRIYHSLLPHCRCIFSQVHKPIKSTVRLSHWHQGELREISLSEVGGNCIRNRNCHFNKFQLSSKFKSFLALHLPKWAILPFQLSNPQVYCLNTNVFLVDNQDIPGSSTKAAN